MNTYQIIIHSRRIQFICLRCRYISGRLHKPIMPLVLPDANHSIRSALKHNLQNAMHTALLLLPDTFQEETLYQTLAGLSYSGYKPLKSYFFLLTSYGK